ncbi:hypothetical protein [Streptomyces sp. NPDC004065]|uniref:hypothetical protein n=1 Tax=Streptomyces sp. NPDC004065 TaxID=3364689 RepID=UPI00384E1328
MDLGLLALAARLLGLLHRGVQRGHQVQHPARLGLRLGCGGRLAVLAFSLDHLLQRLGVVIDGFRPLTAPGPGEWQSGARRYRTVTGVEGGPLGLILLGSSLGVPDFSPDALTMRGAACSSPQARSSVPSALRRAERS